MKKGFNMNKRNVMRLTHATLWTSAIIVSAILGAPEFLTFVLLPVLGSVAVVAST